MAEESAAEGAHSCAIKENDKNFFRRSVGTNMSVSDLKKGLMVKVNSLMFQKKKDPPSPSSGSMSARVKSVSTAATKDPKDKRKRGNSFNNIKKLMVHKDGKDKKEQKDQEAGQPKEGQGEEHQEGGKSPNNKTDSQQQQQQQQGTTDEGHTKHNILTNISEKGIRTRKRCHPRVGPHEQQNDDDQERGGGGGNLSDKEVEEDELIFSEENEALMVSSSKDHSIELKKGASKLLKRHGSRPSKSMSILPDTRKPSLEEANCREERTNSNEDENEELIFSEQDEPLVINTMIFKSVEISLIRGNRNQQRSDQTEEDTKAEDVKEQQDQESSDKEEQERKGEEGDTGEDGRERKVEITQETRAGTTHNHHEEKACLSIDMEHSESNGKCEVTSGPE